MYSISFQDDISMMPRERLMREGAEKLSNQELLSIFLRTGNKKESVFQVSQRILSSISSLNDLKYLTLQELQTISGIGPIKAVELQAIIELGRRINRAEVLQKEQIMGSQKLAQKMQQELGDMRQECLVAIYLNSQNQILHQLSREKFSTTLLSIWRHLSYWYTIIHQAQSFLVETTMR